MRFNIAFEVPGACCPGTLAVEITAESKDEAIEKAREYVGSRAKLKEVREINETKPK